jgi:hypothetical protein
MPAKGFIRKDEPRRGTTPKFLLTLATKGKYQILSYATCIQEQNLVSSIVSATKVTFRTSGHVNVPCMGNTVCDITSFFVLKEFIH